MPTTALRFAVLLVFAMLLLAPIRAPAGEAEWQMHMDTGMAAYQRGDYRSAATSWAAALKEAEAFGETDQRFARTTHNLAALYRAQGRYAEAEPLYRRALSISEKALGLDHPSVETTLGNFAYLYRQQKRWAEGLELARRAAVPRRALRGARGGASRRSPLRATHPFVEFRNPRVAAARREWERGWHGAGGI